MLDVAAHDTEVFSDFSETKGARIKLMASAVHNNTATYDTFQCSGSYIRLSSWCPDLPFVLLFLVEHAQYQEWCLLTHNFLAFFASRTDLAVKQCLLLVAIQDRLGLESRELSSETGARSRKACCHMLSFHSTWPLSRRTWSRMVEPCGFSWREGRSSLASKLKDIG